MNGVQATHLLHTTGNERAILGVHPLIHQATTIASPRRLHLGVDPVVCSKAPWVMEVDGMIQADHHTDLRSGILGRILAIAYPTNALNVCLVDELLAPKFSIFHREKLFQDVLIRTRLGIALSLLGVSPKLVYACNGADEVAVGHVCDG